MVYRFHTTATLPATNPDSIAVRGHHIRPPDIALPNLYSDTMTYCFWFEPDYPFENPTTTETTMNTLDVEYDSNSSNILRIGIQDRTSTTVRFNITQRMDNGAGGIINCFMQYTLAATEPVHIAYTADFSTGVLDANTLKVYRNGVELVATTAGNVSGGVQATAISALAFGGNLDTGTGEADGLAGQVEGFAIFNELVAPADLVDLAARTTTPDDYASCVLHMPLQDRMIETKTNRNGAAYDVNTVVRPFTLIDDYDGTDVTVLPKKLGVNEGLSAAPFSAASSLARVKYNSAWTFPMGSIVLNGDTVAYCHSTGLLRVKYVETTGNVTFAYAEDNKGGTVTTEEVAPGDWHITSERPAQIIFGKGATDTFDIVENINPVDGTDFFHPEALNIVHGRAWRNMQSSAGIIEQRGVYMDASGGHRVVGDFWYTEKPEVGRNWAPKYINPDKTQNGVDDVGNNDGTRGDMLPLELHIEFVNKAGAETFWYAVPLSTTAFQTYAAEYIRDNCACRKVVLELSNELWNFALPYLWAQRTVFDEAVALWGPAGDTSVYPFGGGSESSKTMSMAIKKTLEELVPMRTIINQNPNITCEVVIGGQAGFADPLSIALDAHHDTVTYSPNGFLDLADVSYDAIAIAPYIPATNEVLDGFNNRIPPEDLIAILRDNWFTGTYTTPASTRVQGWYDTAQLYGKKLVFYECGQHITPPTAGIPAEQSEFDNYFRYWRSILNHPDYTDLIQDIIEDCASIGVDMELSCFYSLIADYGRAEAFLMGYSFSERVHPFGFIWLGQRWDPDTGNVLSQQEAQDNWFEEQGVPALPPKGVLADESRSGASGVAYYMTGQMF